MLSPAAAAAATMRRIFMPAERPRAGADTAWPAGTHDTESESLHWVVPAGRIWRRPIREVIRKQPVPAARQCPRKRVKEKKKTESNINESILVLHQKKINSCGAIWVVRWLEKQKKRFPFKKTERVTHKETWSKFLSPPLSRSVQSYLASV